MKKVILGIIPARMGSSRFFGKPLARIADRPMLQWVWDAARGASILTDLVIATCDKEIRQEAESFGARVIMTSPQHETASDRAAEAMLLWEKKAGKRVDIVVMVQGDEPMINAGMVDLAVRPLLKDKSINAVNLVSEITNAAEYKDPNTIKVVIDKDGFALYFSREPIPSQRRAHRTDIKAYKQVCVIPFRRDFIIKFNSMPRGYLEDIESIDMLRILDNGYKVKTVISPALTHSVDTPSDLKRVEKILADSGHKKMI